VRTGDDELRVGQRALSGGNLEIVRRRIADEARQKPTDRELLQLRDVMAQPGRSRRYRPLVESGEPFNPTLSPYPYRGTIAGRAGLDEILCELAVLLQVRTRGQRQCVLRIRLHANLLS
jgi:hypothetical protein